MAKNKVSEYSATAANNTDIGGINIAEGCAPSGINNAIRELMAQLKDMQSGTDGDNFTVGGNLSVTGTSTFSDDIILGGSSGTSGQVLVSQGSGSAPAWGNAFVTGMIMMWSGTIATIPSGWLLCNGSSGTPDLRNRFIIGAHSDDAGVAKTTVTGSATQTGGSKDAINVSHTHTATVTDPGHSHTVKIGESFSGGNSVQYTNSITGNASVVNSNTTGITVSNSTEGSSGTNANLPPYYALAYIMKS
jgi:hypothetical protein